MTERGVFALDRGIFDHPVFAVERFTEREAWAWMIAEAAWCNRSRRFGSFMVELARGELAASIRFLGEKWLWHRAKVDRFLRKLKTETMIETRVETGITVITICNYSKYQTVGLPSEEINEQQSAEVPRQERDRSETKQSIETLKKEEEEIVVEDAREPSLPALASHLPAAERIWLAIGIDADDPTWFGQSGRVAQWLANRWDLDLDILPTIAALKPKALRPIRKLQYFEQAIADAYAARIAPVPIGAAAPRGPPRAAAFMSLKDQQNQDYANARSKLREFQSRPDDGGDGSRATDRLLPARRGE